MTRRRNLGIAIPLTFLAISVVCWFAVDGFRAWVYFALRGAYFAVHPAPPRCKERAAALTAKAELLQQAAKNSLRVGTKKDGVVRFFASENIPLAFVQGGREQEATGTLYFKGLGECSNIACGDDSALIGVRVSVDSDGTVLSDPIVVSMYTNCV
jgi:hypothetical protein